MTDSTGAKGWPFPGFANYLESNAGTCTPDPRLQTIQVQAPPDTTPVKVSYLPGSGSATYEDPLFRLTLSYPRRLHVQRLADGSLVSVEGVEIADYPLGP